MALSRKTLRTLGLIPVVAGLGIIVTPSVAYAGASQSGSTLTITGTFVADYVELDVRADGVVEVKNAPGVTPGTLYSGVTTLVINTQNNDDKVDLNIASSMRIVTDTSTGADSVLVEVLAGTTGTMVVSVDAYTGTNADALEIKAESKGANLDIAAFHSMETNDDKVAMEVKGEGAADWLKAKLRTRDSLSNDTAEMIITSDAAVVDIDMGVDATQGVTAWGEPYSVRYGLSASKLVVDHKAAGTLRANLATLASSNVVELKGTASAKIVNGTVSGFNNSNDSLLVFTEGPVSGNVVLNGGTGIDSCKATVGTKVACEA